MQFLLHLEPVIGLMLFSIELGLLLLEIKSLQENEIKDDIIIKIYVLNIKPLKI